MPTTILNTIPEILHSLKHKKLRALLTGFGVAWGIFILIILLGVSNGLEKGVVQLLSGFVEKSVWIYGGYTSIERGNNKYSKAIYFDTQTLNLLENNSSGLIKAISPEFQFQKQVAYKSKITSVSIKGIYPDFFQLKKLETDKGRLLNEGDVFRKGKVVVIGKRIKEQLFNKSEAIGEYLIIDNYLYLVVGTLKEGSLFDQAEQNIIFMPLQTVNTCFNTGWEFNVLGMSLKTKDTEKAENYLKTYLGRHLGFDTSDKDALYIFNFDKQIKSFQKIFTGLNIFLWFIGFCLLITGMIGITNIMFVVVHERTNEIGIRKAVGATTNQILSMILTETVTITLLAGIIGAMLGSIVIFALKYILNVLVNDDFLIKDISTNWLTIIVAFILLVMCGIIAGLLPAKKATEISTIDAIRYE
ncbi:ABC transporter permease [Roseimarinus sediminis]|jgi:putative ABC transport system permease protein|uniref:ABC transporter permease n=1 Tax=Roseimarinus sediminis TaxID=1610899 RepID=UPI003D2294F3